MIGFGGGGFGEPSRTLFHHDSTASRWMSSRTRRIADVAPMRSTFRRAAATDRRLHRLGGTISEREHARPLAAMPSRKKLGVRVVAAVRYIGFPNLGARVLLPAGSMTAIMRACVSPAWKHRKAR
jgi:hypothetical protein